MKNKKNKDLSCPCGSGKNYAVCCEPLLKGDANAQTAEALMRSRFSAYTLCLTDYLAKTWHPDTVVTKEEIAEGYELVKWLDLKVIDTQQGRVDDIQGVVEYQARYKLTGRALVLHEIAEFVKEDGLWFYVGPQEDLSDEEDGE